MGKGKRDLSDFWITSLHRKSDWDMLVKKLPGDGKRTNDNEDAWKEAIQIFRLRIEERFFEPIEHLNKEAKGKHWGMAIVSLLCAVIETLYVMENDDRSDKTNEHFKKFLAKPFFGNLSKDQQLRNVFTSELRNSLLHEGQTKNRWLIHRESKQSCVVEDHGGMKVLYFRDLHFSVRAAFEDYLGKLQNPSSNSQRYLFLKSMNKMVCIGGKLKQNRS